MRDLLRRALDAVLLRDDPFLPDVTECDCSGCTFAREVDAFTPAHIVAAILLDADSLAVALARADAVTDAVTHAVDVANHEWQQTDPDTAREVAELDALYDSPAFGERGWAIYQDESTRDDPNAL